MLPPVLVLTNKNRWAGQATPAIPLAINLGRDCSHHINSMV